MPIDYTRLPQAADLALFLREEGEINTRLSPSDRETRQAAACEQAADNFERRTSWHPFLASIDVETLKFDATDENGVLNLGTGLVDTDSTVPAVTVNGSSYTLNTQFWLMRSNAKQSSWPYDQIRFQYAPLGFTPWAMPQTIVVTGRVGFCISLPPAAWDAILCDAALIAIPGARSRESWINRRESGVATFQRVSC